MKLKKLTSTQRSLLHMNGVPTEELVNWMYVKTETESVTGSKSASKNNDKTRYMVVQNTATNEIKRVEII